MAIGDTAKLIASLELQDKFSKTADKFDKTVSGMDKRTQALSKIGTTIGAGARTAIDNVGKIALIGAGVVASQVAIGIKSLGELAEVNNQTAAVIKSTGAIANVTAEQIRTQAEALEDLSTVDDKVIQAGQNMLLTFKNVRNEVGEGNDIFTQATETLLDMSVALGTEPSKAAIQLGKALNDPIKGITALTRVGVTFTDQQKEQITALVEAGDTMKAQKIILAELNSEFGNSAKAFGKGPAADMRRFGDAVEGAQQALATGFLPLMTKVSERVQEALGDPKVLANITKFGESAAAGVDQLINIGTKLPWDAIGSSAKLMGQGAKALLDAFAGMPPWVQTAVLTGWGLNKLTGGALGSLAGQLVKGFMPGGAFRGATPATPLFTKEVGLGGVGGNAPIVGGGGAVGTLLRVGGKIFGVAAAGAIGFEIGNILGHQFFDPTVKPAVEFETSQFDKLVTAAEGDPVALQRGLNAVDSGLDDLIGENREGRLIASLLFGDQIRVLESQEATLKQLLSEAQQAGVGNNVPQNPGGVPGTPAGTSELTEGASKAVTSAVQEMHKKIVAALQRGDIAEARLLKAQVDALRSLDNRSEQRNNKIIAGLGRTHAALSTANRNLDEGNARQREMAARIAESRDATRSGFDRTNSQLGILNSKDFSPTVNVDANFNTTVSVSDIIRQSSTYNVATSLSSQTRAGFGANLP